MKTLGYRPESNKMLYINYTSILNKKYIAKVNNFLCLNMLNQGRSIEDTFSVLLKSVPRYCKHLFLISVREKEIDIYKYQFPI